MIGDHGALSFVNSVVGLPATRDGQHAQDGFSRGGSTGG